jgi:hypothetical protein
MGGGGKMCAHPVLIVLARGDAQRHEPVGPLAGGQGDGAVDPFRPLRAIGAEFLACRQVDLGQQRVVRALGLCLCVPGGGHVHPRPFLGSIPRHRALIGKQQGRGRQVAGATGGGQRMRMPRHRLVPRLGLALDHGPPRRIGLLAETARDRRRKFAHQRFDARQALFPGQVQAGLQLQEPGLVERFLRRCLRTPGEHCRCGQHAHAPRAKRPCPGLHPHHRSHSIALRPVTDHSAP